MQTKQEVTPACTVSAFLEKGVLSPEEFILAGDKLVNEYWGFEWERGDPEKRKPYFPDNKQYLSLRNVYCSRRFVSGKEEKDAEADEIDPATLRRYEIDITYDEYYQTPRVWFTTAFGKSGTPIRPELVFEDISQDNGHISLTFEKHDHHRSSLLLYPTVHPSMNAAGMKKIIDDLISQGVEPQVDKYLLMFMKFMAPFIPFIDYGYDMEDLDSAISKIC